MWQVAQKIALFHQLMLMRPADVSVNRTIDTEPTNVLPRFSESEINRQPSRFSVVLAASDNVDTQRVVYRDTLKRNDMVGSVSTHRKLNVDINFFARKFAKGFEFFAIHGRSNQW